jgi:hypothetical protein
MINERYICAVFCVSCFAWLSLLAAPLHLVFLAISSSNAATNAQQSRNMYIPLCVYVAVCIVMNPATQAGTTRTTDHLL